MKNLDETPPHGYIPPGPIEAQPWEGGYCQPETRQEAFAAVLQGVTMGAYDERMVSWLVGWDDPTCRAVASLMWRCRIAGAAELAARRDAGDAERCAQCGGSITPYTDPYDGETTRWRHVRIPDAVAEFLDADHGAEPRRGGDL